MIARVLYVLVALVCAIALVGCEGERGPRGIVGVDGQDGNANVVMFEFGSRTTTLGRITYQFAASRGLVDSSLVLGYANPSDYVASAWIPVPGIGPLDQYMTRSFWHQTSTNPSTYTYTVGILWPDGSGPYTNSVTFTKFKIILAPASSITVGTASGKLDLADYRSVRDYFGLSD